jgi:putative sterol carrier protein
MFKFVLKAGLVAGNFALLAGFAVTAHAAPVMMSSEWGSAVCDAWNQDSVLTDELASSGWVDNNAGRPSKVMHVYRSDCGDEPTAEIRIAPVDGKAQCVYGGAVETTTLNKKVDYRMHAKTSRWIEMGSGEYGPMKAMSFMRLKFSGPKWEAMKNMGPFSSFLLLVGVVSSDTATCP